MNKSIILFFLSFLFLSKPLIAGLYEAKMPYDQNHDDQYSLWVKSTLKHDIFSNKESPYYGLKTDCADAALALKIIFAFENKLSIEFILNDGSKISEKTTLFDNKKLSEIEKVFAFIDYLSENIGSEILAEKNTYPIKVEQIKPGDLYITRWSNNKGKITRHVYIIKEILPTGDFLLLSSTQPRAIRPLLGRKGMPIHLFNGAPFGFKRFKSNLMTPQHLLKDFSFEQYSLAKEGEAAFFSKIKNSLKNETDTLEMNIRRRFENICVALNSRKDIIDLAIENKPEHKCFTKNDYDLYSTPSRDSNIIQDIERLRNGFVVIVKRGQQNELSTETYNALSYLIGESQDQQSFENLKNFCTINIPVDVNTNKVINIKSFYDRFKSGHISSNPNENELARWGLSTLDNKCKNL